MNNATTSQPLFAALPGTTASGVARASQLVEFTPYMTLRVETPQADMSASPRELFVLKPPQAYRKPVAVSPRTPLAAEEYPVLAKIWDNEEDDIFNAF